MESSSFMSDPLDFTDLIGFPERPTTQDEPESVMMHLPREDFPLTRLLLDHLVDKKRITSMEIPELIQELQRIRSNKKRS